ncbi:hypothetical protein BLNAU_8058 [Blattamonas nauphoetae]|uniref:Uncharacterized protein n=1 Tax=Blattamonas nauphoetae TaxID=2049346 RepID=A0ABQ9XZT1_9EUKA|nr:hypothetical protein BLNAU_8058 [Blattamonas nauphoetae]
MTAIDKKTDASTSSTRSVMSIPQFPFPGDCSPFLNWTKGRRDDIHSKAIVFRSLVATLKSQPALDDSLEAKAVRFLESAKLGTKESADAFLDSFESSSDESSTKFVQCIVVLISSASQVITMAAMKIHQNLMWLCSTKNLLLLITADLIPHLINTLNPLSLSYAEGVGIHINIMKSVRPSLLLTTSNGLEQLGIEVHDERQAVHETVFQRVLVPSEKYIRHLCVNRYSIVDRGMSNKFMVLLVRLLHICHDHQPTLDCVLHMPIVLTIPRCLSFFEYDDTIYHSLNSMIGAKLDWNKTMGTKRQMEKNVHRMLRMEGIDDVMEEKLQNDQNEFIGRWIVAFSIDWNNLQGLNHPERE